jgi:hypothetical protein
MNLGCLMRSVGSWAGRAMVAASLLWVAVSAAPAQTSVTATNNQGSTTATVTATPPTTGAAPNGASGGGNTVTTETVVRVQVTSPLPAPAPVKQRLIAIFIKNRADKTLDEKVGSLEELLTAKLAGTFADKELPVSIVSREDVLNAVSTFADQGANKGDEKLAGAELDKLLSNNTSAVRLSQTLNADYLLMVTITQFSRDVKAFDGYGVTTVNVEDKMGLSYKTLDGTTGGTIDGGTVESTHRRRLSKESVQGLTVANELLSDASTKISSKVSDRLAKTLQRAPATDVAKVNLTVIATLQGTTLPEIVKNDKGQWVVGEGRYAIAALNASVDLDGFTLGSAPGTFSIPKGTHKISINRQGCDNYDKTLLINNDMKLEVPLRMTDAEFVRHLTQIAFLQELKQGAALTEGQVNVLNGTAEYLRNSHMRVDATNMPTTMVNVNQQGVTTVNQNTNTAASFWTKP